LYFILSGKVFVPQYLKTAQAVLVNDIVGGVLKQKACLSGIGQKMGDKIKF
jgi:hypothetical protein